MFAVYIHLVLRFILSHRLSLRKVFHVKSSEVLGEVISPGEALPALSIAFELRAVDICDVVAGLEVPCHIGFAAEELFRLPIVVLTISMWTESSVVCDSPVEQSEA